MAGAKDEAREGKGQEELAQRGCGAEGTGWVSEGQKPQPPRVSRDVTIIKIP